MCMQLIFKIPNEIPGNAKTYKPIDTVMNQDEVVNYPTELLNSLDLPGFPPHTLILKTRVPIILLRNINPPQLCNGTRLSVKTLMNKCHRSHNFEWQTQGEDVCYHVLQWFQQICHLNRCLVSRATCFCNYYKQSTRTIVASVWNRFKETVLLT